MVMRYPTIEDNQPTVEQNPTGMSDDIAQILLGRAPRRTGRGEHKKRDKNDISTRPPKPKKPVKINNIQEIEDKADYGNCRCGRPAIGRHWACAIHM